MRMSMRENSGWNSVDKLDKTTLDLSLRLSSNLLKDRYSRTPSTPALEDAIFK